MADLSQLGTLKTIEPLDLDMYPEARENTFRLPVKGRYTVQAPGTFTFGRTKKDDLSATVDPTIVGPTNEGFTLRFTKVSNKQFKRDGRPASQLGDYLKACGIRGRMSDEQEAADLVEQTANLTYTVDLDWRAYHTGTQFAVEGMERFPSDGNGGHIPWYPHPTEKGEDGEALKLRANVIVNRYVSAS